MPEDVTQLLLDWSKGDQSALDKLMPVVYDELRQLARRYMSRERPDHTLQVTALIHEAYLRLVNQKRARWQNRAQFFGIAAQLMRRILVDHARCRNFQKRGGQKLPLDEALALSANRSKDVLALDEALQRLASIDPRKSRVVELRYFGGLTLEEIADTLNISAPTVMRDWRLAKAWLRQELGHDA